ncbi:MAG: immune inhibitor A domain-containing protein [Gammaproteobacteria bacterium]
MKTDRFSAHLAVALFSISVASVAAAMPPIINGTNAPAKHPVKSDNLKHPLGNKRHALRLKAFESQLNGEAVGAVMEVKPGQYVELSPRSTEKIFTILGEFGTKIHPTYGGTPGPLHNQIPKPDRTVNNVDIWTPDFNPAYYRNLLFATDPGANSMHNYYLEQSSGRYTVTGKISDWVKVPYNEARYGSNKAGDKLVWAFVRDSANAWYKAQIAAGKTPADIDAYLSQFDVWDRYDWDHDGNFNEPDGYIDHFQVVHAGIGEEAGGGAQGTDAIWSHRWYAYYNLIGNVGPSPAYLLGGTRIGNSSYWIGDYTVEPENGGVGVFAHEYGHDLGLIDLYDTAGAENSTGFWTLYSGGSWGSSGKPKDGIGSKPVSMSAYEKLFLGWSNVKTLAYKQQASVVLGPVNTKTTQAQQLVLRLPRKKVTFYVGDPYAGSFFYYSDKGNNLDTKMIREMTLPGGVATLSAKVKYDIERDWDYAYLTVNGTAVQTNRSTKTNPNGQNFGNGITGKSAGWVNLTADLSAYAGQTVSIGFRYWTDAAVVGDGLSIDKIAVSGQPVDGGETDPGWTYDGFERTGGTIAKRYYNAYFAEYRTYHGYDDSLRTGPYNFGFLNDPLLGNWVEHFPYQDGLLIWYYDTSFEDNNVGEHCAAGRCGGLVLPVDAHPRLLLRPDDGMVWRPRIQAYDSTFGLEKTDRICLHQNGIKGCYGGLAAKPVFNDLHEYWVAPDDAIGNYGWSGVQVPHTGTTVRVDKVTALRWYMRVMVNEQ